MARPSETSQCRLQGFIDLKQSSSLESDQREAWKRWDGIKLRYLGATWRAGRPKPPDSSTLSMPTKHPRQTSDSPHNADKQRTKGGESGGLTPPRSPKRYFTIGITSNAAWGFGEFRSTSPNLNKSSPTFAASFIPTPISMSDGRSNCWCTDHSEVRNRTSYVAKIRSRQITGSLRQRNPLHSRCF
jgi:hypothetical protein